MSSKNSNATSVRKLLELFSAAGLILSLVFVAYEIRQNTLAARAGAIQQIGIATAEMWGEFARDPLMLRIMENRSDIPSEDWTADDWARALGQMLAWARLAETGLLQVQEGLLPESSLQLLGYSSTKLWLTNSQVNCLWKHRMRNMVSQEFAEYAESGAMPAPIDCSKYPNFPFLTPESSSSSGA